MKHLSLPILLALCFLVLPARAQASNEEAIATLNLARFQLPEYPPGARQAGISEGSVIVALETRRTAPGPVGEYLILRASDPRFEESVTRALRGWQFAAPKPGQPTPATVGASPTVIRFQFVSTGVVTISVPDYQALRTAKVTSAAGNRVVLPTFADLDRVPESLAQPMPGYPDALKSRPVSGSAAVRFFVDEEGRVRLPSVTAATEPEFAEAALNVLPEWRFQVPMLGGKPVIAMGTWSFNFGPAPR